MHNEFKALMLRCSNQMIQLASQNRYPAIGIKLTTPTFMHTIQAAVARSPQSTSFPTNNPILLRVDRNRDGRAGVVYFDFQRRGMRDPSFWEENFDGHFTLDPDGSLIPSRFESYEAFFCSFRPLRMPK
jgi:hypothetical protein